METGCAHLRPDDEAGLLAMVIDAVKTGRPMAIHAGGSKAGFGRPVVAPAMLDLSGLAGIIDYQPEELMLTLRPGTPLAEVEALLAARGQMLAFEPPGLAALCGADDGAGATIGGTVAAGMAGPRRIRAGGARDHLLGFSAISGRAERFKAGAKVVKNVTGYDLPKLIAGSFGTLALMTELTLKVLPAPEDIVTLVVPAPADTAVTAMTRLQIGPLEPTGLAWLPAALAGDLTEAAEGVLLIRFEGPDGALADRIARAGDAGIGAAGTRVLAAGATRPLWRRIAEVAGILNPQAGEAVWRLSVPPASGARVLAAALACDDARGFIDWGGGLVWVALPEGTGGDGGAGHLRQAVAAQGGGHATLLRGSDILRRRVAVFEPEPPVLARLSERVRAGFDPHGLFNPGRMRASDIGADISAANGGQP
ncbi:glycolate oxidase subunit GlcE [Tistrella bauzanensis]|uniref:glycolate oxidase subunit GlcE n=1 Tax=Tistrella bauzanensis TaxID=657419 RepID=UPI0016659880|nr:glycolate oxidase subunit GlcE [Tistrella bauzanensis]